MNSENQNQTQNLQYQEKTEKQHILENPDTYTGSSDNVTGQMYIFKDSCIKLEEIEYNPALYKLFDEAVVNCLDHVVRTKTRKEKDGSVEVANTINIEIKDDMITLTNNGDGIDIDKHPILNIYYPEMIFSRLRTSTNYDKDEKKITGGKNGFGVKLVFIWSTWGKIETVDAKRQLKYSQIFENNLDKIHKPKITESKKKPYTMVQFIPDYKRLGLSNLTESMISLFQRRVYDIAGITTKDVKVKYNDELVPVKDFNHYVQFYNKNEFVSENPHERWSYIVTLGDELTQVSFVNGIFTSKGGRHVDYIINQIVKKMVAYILKKKKVDVKPSIIKEQINIYLNCVIENPSFDSQTKDYLNTPQSKFGSVCVVGDKFIEKLANLGIMNTSCELSEIKDKKESKKTDGIKSKKIRGIPKLIDANSAGTKESESCTLILCEGDSAKSGIVSGLSATDRNIYGVFPMKGKLFNVRGETIKRINDNSEISDIKKIMGLETGKHYNDASSLRYGKILIMSDQDLDGSHIKGLFLNMIECLWPSLLKIKDFIGFMNTPILKATKGKEILSFYNDNEYEEWKLTHSSGWKIKYYKGLGTSTSTEFKEYFKHKKMVNISVEEKDIDDIDMLFNKKRSESRKTWLSSYNRDEHVDTSKPNISLGDFVHKEMKHFSKYDCDRSIPNLMDGFKISNRKIMFGVFERNLKDEIKVAQLTGYVSEKSGYHHGEASLNGAIVNMAQDFVGSNNINLLLPNGQFGTRLQGGKDSASERYIFTKLNPITRYIFQKKDESILTYLDDDGQKVEPIFYVPIIPMVIVNGTEGIGTGFSTKIPSFNPSDIINYIKSYLEGKLKESQKEFIPYYKGFKGTIYRDDENPTRFITKGVYSIKKNKVEITELPIGLWNEDYIIYLERLIDLGTIKDYKDMSTDKNVNIQVVLVNDDNVEKTLKLTSYLSINNMNLFNKDEQLTHYNEIHEICDDFIKVRLEYYNLRKIYLIKLLNNECELLKNKHAYISELLKGTIDLRKKTTIEINGILEKNKYIKIDNTYNYLIKMTMDSVCEENVEHLQKEYELKIKELDETIKLSIQNMWLNELVQLEKFI
jgi:DNA topoisomerase-2